MCQDALSQSQTIVHLNKFFHHSKVTDFDNIIHEEFSQFKKNFMSSFEISQSKILFFVIKSVLEFFQLQ